MLPSPSFHCDAVIANIQPTRVGSEIGFRSVGSNPPTPPTVVRGRFGGSANSLPEGGVHGKKLTRTTGELEFRGEHPTGTQSRLRGSKDPGCLHREIPSRERSHH